MGKLNLLTNICLFTYFQIASSLLGISTPILCSFPASFVCNFQIDLLQRLFFLLLLQYVVNILDFVIYSLSVILEIFLFWTSYHLSIFLLSFKFSFPILLHVYALTNVSQINLKTYISSSKKILIF